MNRTHRGKSPSPGPILRLIHGHWAAAAVATAAFYSVFDFIGSKSRTCGQIAQSANLCPKGTQVLLDALVGLKLLEVQRGRYRNSEAAGAYLVKGNGNYFGDMSRALFLSGGVGKIWPALPEVVKEGTAKAEWPGLLRVFRPREYSVDLVEGIRTITTCAARAAAGRLRFADRGRVSILDVGGGSGAFSEVLLEENREATATQVDYPMMNELARRHLDEAKLGRRFRTVDGGFATADLDNGFGLAIYSFVAHFVSAEENARNLRRMWELLTPGGTAILNDYLMDENRSGDQVAMLSGLNWLYFSTSGQVWRRSEVRRWFRTAGFRDVRFQATPVSATLVYGRK